jgi:phosphoribosylanthranilate isomerase
MIFTKVCGLRKKEEIDAAIEYGYNAIGIVLYPKSVRYVDAEKAAELARYAKGKILTVAVAVSYNEVAACAGGFDFIQLYEETQLDNFIFSGKRPPVNVDYKYFLYDVSRGSGVEEEFPDFDDQIKSKLIVSGGLTIENVARVIQKIKPFGVDVSSGVEKERGVKDLSLMKRFIEEVRNAE